MAITASDVPVVKRSKILPRLITAINAATKPMGIDKQDAINPKRAVCDNLSASNGAISVRFDHDTQSPCTTRLINRNSG